MAFMQCSFFSESLGTGAHVNVIVPQKYPAAKNPVYPVLYLLHGLSDDHTIWMRRTSIERYVEGMNLIVVMPGAERSFYADMEFGYKYWTYISEELPEIMKSFFPISDKREDTFAAGLSMGGYGAMKLALNHPERYAAAASLSSAVDPIDCMDLAILPESEINTIYGSKENVKGSINDLFSLSQKVAASKGPKPALFQSCGTEDILYQANLKLRDHLRKLSFDYTYEEEHGEHNWEYWDRNIQKIIKWLPLKK